MKESMAAVSGTTYHHGKSQWFVKGHIPGGTQGSGLLYGSDGKALPKDPQKTDPLSQLKRESESSSYSRAYHLQNLHDRGYETKVVPTNNAPIGSLGNENHRRRQHFIKGVTPGGSMENRMIYGTDELLRQSQERQKVKSKENPIGFMYGTEAATNVGKPKPSRKPNNALLLEAKTFEDQAYKNKQLAFDQDEFLEKHRKEKRKQWEEIQTEKKRDLEMLRSFEPWGRPGGGAPLSNTDKWETRRTKSIRTLQDEESAPFGTMQRGGGGAPKRTESGKPITSMRGDPELRFPVYSQSGDIDPNLRYKKDSGYRRDLDNFMDEVKARKEIERQQSFEKELQHISQDPFGKPGGGAPIRNDKGQLKSSFPTTLSKDIEELRHVESRHPHAYNDIKEKESDSRFRHNESFDPWGKGYGTALRDKNGRVIRPNKPDTNDMDGIGMLLGRPGAGAPNKDQDGNIRTRKAQTLTRTTFGDNFSRDFSPKGGRDSYNPFGKPGAGAPVRDSDGRVKTSIMGKVEHETREYSPNTTRNELIAKQSYLKTLQDMQERAHMQRKAEDAELRKSGEDVASWLRTGVVGQPKFDPVTKEIVAAHKQTSDVTQQKLNIRRQKNELSELYHSDLEALARERQQQRDREKEFDKNTSQKHVNTMNHIWGRPGGGAPLTQGDMVNARKQKVGLAPADELGFRLM
ncbi:uncharacterized protein LOC116295486 isoform X2 [Actinia tenebrosa]|uniref:Uncharacterized protein LOC116295486 isoform X2 n=1 Tax=Actinia tenebrosa TaxID=6105 RepID=A0A6P8HS06_ACTTE|nr:uncharacterized protein LOC116295486 isoform X2 [Actinia tenebrosa]XP_031559169.1 uncharacterized protein LOC116295486 isoform X2 [Actinia tenebrosa]